MVDGAKYKEIPVDYGAGGGRMIHAGDPISYANIESRYWTGHFYSGGRLP